MEKDTNDDKKKNFCSEKINDNINHNIVVII